MKRKRMFSEPDIMDSVPDELIPYFNDKNSVIGKLYSRVGALEAYYDTTVYVEGIFLIFEIWDTYTSSYMPESGDIKDIVNYLGQFREDILSCANGLKDVNCETVADFSNPKKVLLTGELYIDVKGYI